MSKSAGEVSNLDSSTSRPSRLRSVALGIALPFLIPAWIVLPAATVALAGSSELVVVLVCAWLIALWFVRRRLAVHFANAILRTRAKQSTRDQLERLMRAITYAWAFVGLLGLAGSILKQLSG